MSIVQNRKAYFNYEILEKFEAGIVLRGNEVKSIRNGHVQIGDAFVTLKEGEAWIHNTTIQPYDKTSHYQPDPTRMRKILIRKDQIRRLIGKVQEKGLTLIVLSLYYKQALVKCEIGLGKGKKNFDKRDSLKKKTLDREAARGFKGIVS